MEYTIIKKEHLELLIDVASKYSDDITSGLDEGIYENGLDETIKISTVIVEN